MKGKLALTLGIFLAMVGSSFPLEAQEKLDGEAIMEKSQIAFFYAGDDMKIKVFMRLISREGKERIREMTMLRKDAQRGGEQRYFIYFHQPGDVRGMTFMVWKYQGRDDDRWLFVPAIDLVKRIAARDKRSSFVGSDFTYEDVSGREVEADRHTLLREETMSGKQVYLIESLPKEEAEYTRKLSWIDKGTFLPLKEEYYDQQGELYKVFTAGEVREIQGVPTITKRTMQNVKSGHHSEVVFQEVTYNIGLPDDLFSERYLRRIPQRWIE